MAGGGSGRFWCYYCDQRFQDERTLLRHQKQKHFVCKICDPPVTHLSLAGLKFHSVRTHKDELEEVPGAIQGRRGVKTEVMGMTGIPEDALASFQKDLEDEKRAAMFAGEADPTAAPVSKDTAAVVALAKKNKKVAADPDLIVDSDLITDNLPPHHAAVATLSRGWPTAVPQVFTELTALATHIATELKDKANVPGQEVAPPVKKPQKKITEAFDPSLLAKRIASKGEGLDILEEVVAKKPEPTVEEEEEEEEQPQRSAKISFSFGKKLLEPDEILPPPVPKADKSAVSDLLSMVSSSRAAAAEAAAAAKAEAKAAFSMKVQSNLPTKLAIMNKNQLFKFAKDVGAKEDDITRIKDGPGEVSAITQLILDLEKQEKWMTVTFKPGKLGIQAHWPTAKVTVVPAGGQGQSHGIKPGMVFLTIDGQKFSKEVLKEKIAGVRNYKAVLATVPSDFRPTKEDEEEEEDDEDEYDYSDEEEYEYEREYEQSYAVAAKRRFQEDEDMPMRQQPGTRLKARRGATSRDAERPVERLQEYNDRPRYAQRERRDSLENQEAGFQEDEDMPMRQQPGSRLKARRRATSRDAERPVERERRDSREPAPPRRRVKEVRMQEIP